MSLFPIVCSVKINESTHTAIVENKRLGHALALVKAQQDLRLATRVMTNSEKGDYRKRPRKIYKNDRWL